MPKIYLNYPEGTFSNGALDSLAAEITACAPRLEQLPDTPYVRSNIWLYAKAYPADTVYHGGKAGGTKIISFEVNAIEGGLTPDAKKEMIAFLTEAVGKHTGIPPEARVPVFVLIRDVPAHNWGMFGKPVTLEALRNPPSDAVPV